MTKFRITIAVLAVASVMSGCATTKVEQPIAARPYVDPIAQSIAQSAQLIEQSVKEMKVIDEVSKLPNISPEQRRQLDAQLASVPPGLGAKITVAAFDGPFTTLTGAIASSVGWAVRVEGNRPPIIEPVHKSYNQVRAIDALRDIGYSVSGATVLLNPVEKTVVIRFK